jgi:xanthine dehydrogenase iron-sulfur-binding subunit
MMKSITLHINGKPETFTIDVRQSLSEVLRDNGYMSVKEGCGAGECGSCTVLLDEAPINTCIFLAVWADGCQIRTAEGEIKNNQLSRVQQAYVDEGAVQCGFCTPGFVMTTTAFVEKHKGKKISRDQIRKGHAGNLCRCTGYNSIVNAVEKCMTPCGPEKE